MTTTIAACLSCGGPQMTNHPGGILEMQHNAHCTLLPFEDATRVADYDRQWWHGRFSRPATPTEVMLLTGLGYVVPAQMNTTIAFLTQGVRRREWPLKPLPA